MDANKSAVQKDSKEEEKSNLQKEKAKELGGDKGNYLYTKELDTEAKEGKINPSKASVTEKTDSSNGKEKTQSPLHEEKAKPLGGDKGNYLYTKELDTDAKEGKISPSKASLTEKDNEKSKSSIEKEKAKPLGGDKGNYLYTKELDTDAKEGKISPSKASLIETSKTDKNEPSPGSVTQTKASREGGDKGNYLYTKELDTDAAEGKIKPKTATLTENKDNKESVKTSIEQEKSFPEGGDKGNVLYTKELDASKDENTKKTSASITGDKGNPYYSKELDASKPPSSTPAENKSTETPTTKKS